MTEKQDVIVTICPACRKKYKVSQTFIGRSIKCKQCNQQFEIAEMGTDRPFPRLGQMGISKKVFTQAQLEKALGHMARENAAGRFVSLPDVLLEEKIVTKDILDKLMIATMRDADKEFGELAVQRNYASRQVVDAGLSKQAEIFKATQSCCMLGDILVTDGHMTKSQYLEILLGQDRRDCMCQSKVLNAETETAHTSSSSTSATIPESEIDSSGETVVGTAAPETETPDDGALEEAEKRLEIFKDKKFFRMREMDKAFGRTAVAYHYVSHPEMRKALEEQLRIYEEAKIRKSLGDILQDVGLITSNQCKTIWMEQERFDLLKKKFGEIAVEQGFVTASEIDKALEEQQKREHEGLPKLRIGDMLQRLGVLTEEQCNQIVAIQSEVNRTFKPQEKERSDAEKLSQINIDGCNFELILSKDGLAAFLNRLDNPPNELTASNIKAALNERKIAYGLVDDTLIEGFLKYETHKEKRFKVAQGKAPLPGRDGTVRYGFEVDHLKAGAVMDSGHIDFKDRGEIPHVTKGDLIAEIVPDIEGEDGIDIYGIPIRVEKVKQVKLRAGKGVELSEDGLKAFAKIDGQPMSTFGGEVSVWPEITIDGDVGLETGHVEFEGNVRVKGGINSGFKVKAGNLTAREILAAEIEATGDVEVSGGITGATITSGGSVTAKYIKNATIFAFGDVRVQREMIDTTIEVSGKCLVPRGVVISSEIIARGGIESKDVGTDISTPCKLKVGVDAHADKEIQKLKDALAALREQQEALMAEQKDLKAQEQQIHHDIAELAQVQDSAIAAQRSLQDKYEESKSSQDATGMKKLEKLLQDFEQKIKNTDAEIDKRFERQDLLSQRSGLLNGKIQALDEKAAVLEDKKADIVRWSREHKGVAQVKVSGTIQEGTAVFGSGSSVILRKSYKSVRINEVRNQDPESDAEWEMKVQIQR